mmetsp:Transcript_30943/g.80280  ORF Transcript_30943/g.80280 Transcript_30943/m.80280 type:complete len:400 (+) Transcript_30943:401-1600(+)
MSDASACWPSTTQELVSAANCSTARTRSNTRTMLSACCGAVIVDNSRESTVAKTFSSLAATVEAIRAIPSSRDWEMERTGSRAVCKWAASIFPAASCCKTCSSLRWSSTTVFSAPNVSWIALTPAAATPSRASRAVSTTSNLVRKPTSATACKLRKSSRSPRSDVPSACRSSLLAQLASACSTADARSCVASTAAARLSPRVPRVATRPARLSCFPAAASTIACTCCKLSRAVVTSWVKLWKSLIATTPSILASKLARSFAVAAEEEEARRSATVWATALLSSLTLCNAVCCFSVATRREAQSSEMIDISERTSSTPCFHPTSTTLRLLVTSPIPACNACTLPCNAGRSTSLALIPANSSRKTLDSLCCATLDPASPASTSSIRCARSSAALRDANTSF